MNKHHLSAHYLYYLFSGHRMQLLYYVLETIVKVMIKKFANHVRPHYC